ncbi:hypothetical protein [Trichococcus sp.]|uniref:hypothetical protein n=1 Tax=Trichococcus sp. TaxID=1985464 RepID=UPI003C7CDB17
MKLGLRFFVQQATELAVVRIECSSPAKAVWPEKKKNRTNPYYRKPQKMRHQPKENSFTADDAFFLWS